VTINLGYIKPASLPHFQLQTTGVVNRRLECFSKLTKNILLYFCVVTACFSVTDRSDEFFFQTDKAVVAMEADEDGVVAKIFKEADSGPIQVTFWENIF
jgi:hypothetical protein